MILIASAAQIRLRFMGKVEYEGMKGRDGGRWSTVQTQGCWAVKQHAAAGYLITHSRPATERYSFCSDEHTRAEETGIVRNQDMSFNYLTLSPL